MGDEMREEEMPMLEACLVKNFAHLGFSLDTFEDCHYPGEYHSGYIRGTITCPCGGREYFSFTYGYNEIKYSGSYKVFATRILHRVASKEHLEEDVANGTLPAFDVNKHVFKELIS